MSENDSKAEDNFSIERYIKYITYIPLLAPLLAVGFDVGSFYAININFFTLFSLSEHVLFALEALPIVIVLLLFVSILLPFFAYQPKKRRPPVWARKHPRLAAIIALTIIGLILGTVTIIIVSGIWAMDFASRLVIAYMFLFIVVPVVVLFPPVSSRSRYWSLQRLSAYFYRSYSASLGAWAFARRGATVLLDRKLFFG